MTEALPEKTLPASEDDAGVSQMDNVEPAQPTAESSRFQVGQIIGDQDIRRAFRFDTEVGSHSRRDVVLADGFEASVDELDEERYKIRQIWRAGEEPYPFDD